MGRLAMGILPFAGVVALRKFFVIVLKSFVSLSE